MTRRGLRTTLLRAAALLAAAAAIAAADSRLRPVQLRMAESPPEPAKPVAGTTAPTVVPPVDPPAGETPPPDAASDASPAAAAAPIDVNRLGARIGLAESRALWESGLAIYLDSRKKSEYEEGHIQNALLFPADDMGSTHAREAMQFLDPDLPVVIYCNGGSCDASELVAIRLQQLGYRRVHVMIDGFPAWKDAGYPVSTGMTP